MSVLYLTWGDGVAAVGAPTLSRYASGDTESDHPRWDAALASASDEMEEYLRRRGATLPIPVPLQPSFHANLLALTLDYLTQFADRRPQSIETNAARARRFFERVATGRNTVEGGGELPSTEPPFVHRAPSVFDPNDPDSEISRRLPPL
jgi:hypothetical protein